MVISFIMVTVPFEDYHKNTKEAVNESIVLVAAYPLLMCTFWLADPEVRLVVGWAIIGCICASLLFNLGCFLFSLV